MMHVCHVKGCGRDVNPRMLMCVQHWKLVPRRLQNEVKRTFRAAQCRDKAPSEEWVTAARAALDAVAKVEKRRA